MRTYLAVITVKIIEDNEATASEVADKIAKSISDGACTPFRHDADVIAVGLDEETCDSDCGCPNCGGW